MQGHIHKRVHTDRDGKETVRWYVVVDVGIDSDGRRRQKWHGGFRTRREAEVAAPSSSTTCTPARMWCRAHHARGWVRDSWLPMTATRVKPSTFTRTSRNLEIHVLPDAWDEAAAAADAADAQHPVRAPPGELGPQTGKPLSAKTISYIHTTIHKVLADAVDAGLSREERGRSRSRRGRRDERRTGSSVGASRARAVPRRWSGDPARGRSGAIAAMTGMRRGEVLGLRWQRRRPRRGRLSVRQALVAVAYATIESTPKSHNARVIDLDAETVDSAPSPSGAAGRRARRVGRRTIKTTTSSSPRRTASRSILTRSASRSSDSSRTPNSGRSGSTTSATPTRLSRSRPACRSRSISERLGHESPAFTLKQYAHVIPGMQAEAAAQVASLVDERDHDA